MKITNQYNLPEAIVRAICNDPYPDIPEGSGLSCTTLIAPPYQRRLQREHKEEIVEDAMDRLWALYGQTVHSVCERGVGEFDVAETRLYGECHGFKIHGQVDLLEAGKYQNKMDDHFEYLTDFKFTSVYSAKSALAEGKDDWNNQLNVLDYLCKCNDIHVDKLRVVVLAKDWRLSEARRDPNYPPRVIIVNIHRWDVLDQEEYITKQCLAHTDDDPQPCTLEERWYRPGKVAVMKKGRKSALRLLDSTDEAENWAINNGTPVGGQIYLEHRPGVYPRCAEYCSAAPFCDEWKRVQEELERESG